MWAAPRKIEFISIQYFLFKMLEQVNYNDLVKGQQYFVIHRRGAVFEGNLIYDGNHFFKYPNSIQTFQLICITFIDMLLIMNIIWH